MNLELISALASLTTAIIIGATAVAAMVQLRHMRSSNEINAQLAVRTMMNDVRKEGDLLRNGLTAAMADPAFRRYIRAMASGETCARTPEHQAFYDNMESHGEFCRHHARLQRQPNMWESWEYICARAMQWGQRRHDTYPKGVPRLDPKNAWAGEHQDDVKTPERTL